MGQVFSCLATSFMYIGEILENVFLAVGEVSAVLVRLVFNLLVSLCDLFATISCCCRVPWSERPARGFDNHSSQFAAVGGRQVMAGIVTKEGRERRQQEKEAAKKEKELKAEAYAAAKKEKKEAELKAKEEKAAAAKKDKEEKAAAAQKAKEDKEAAAKKAKEDKEAAAKKAKEDKEKEAAAKKA